MITKAGNTSPSASTAEPGRSRPAARVVRAASAGLLLASLICLAAPAHAATTDWLQRVNAFRQQNGLGTLSVDGQLQSLAQQRSDTNARSGRLEHTPVLSDGLPPNWGKLAENVGFGPSADAIWNAFLNSPTHRANLADPAFTHIGVGETIVGGRIWVTHRFMSLGSVSDTGSTEPQPIVIPQPPLAQPPSAQPMPARTAANTPNDRGGAPSTNATSTTPGARSATSPSGGPGAAGPAGPSPEPEANAEASSSVSIAPDSPRDVAAVVDALTLLQQ